MKVSADISSEMQDTRSSSKLSETPKSDRNYSALAFENIEYYHYILNQLSDIAEK